VVAKRFGSASAFKAALEARLRKKSQESGIPFSTLQLKFVIERLLARLFRDDAPPWLLKGGFAMDLRFRPRARTTKDIDLSVVLVGLAAGPTSSDLRDRLQAAAEVELGDYLTYRIGEPRAELTNAPRGVAATRAKRCSSEKPTRSSTSTSGSATPWWANPID
jgi:hypothetical protein